MGDGRSGFLPVVDGDPAVNKGTDGGCYDVPDQVVAHVEGVDAGHGVVRLPDNTRKSIH